MRWVRHLGRGMPPGPSLTLLNRHSRIERGHVTSTQSRPSARGMNRPNHGMKRSTYVKFITQSSDLRRHARFAGRPCRHRIGGNQLAEESPAPHAGESSSRQSEQTHPSRRQERHVEQGASLAIAPRGSSGAAGGARHGEPERRSYHQGGTAGAERPGERDQQSDSAEITGRCPRVTGKRKSLPRAQCLPATAFGAATPRIDWVLKYNKNKYLCPHALDCVWDL